MLWMGCKDILSKTQGHLSPSSVMSQPPSLSGRESLFQAMLYFLPTPGVQEIGEMVGLNSEELEKALCSRTMKTAKEKVVTALNVIQVRALCVGDLGTLLWLPS